ADALTRQWGRKLLHIVSIVANLPITGVEGHYPKYHGVHALHHGHPRCPDTAALCQSSCSMNRSLVPELPPSFSTLVHDPSAQQGPYSSASNNTSISASHNTCTSSASPLAAAWRMLATA